MGSRKGAIGSAVINRYYFIGLCHRFDNPEDTVTVVVHIYNFKQYEW